MNFDFSVVTGETVAAYLTEYAKNCEVIKYAYLLHGEQKTVNPPSYFLRFPEKPGCRIIALPAFVDGEFAVSGIKWIASYPQNRAKGFPRASAVLILNDYETGYPLVCMESSIISAVRTAASAVLAADYMTGGEKRCARLGFVGNGLIAKYIYKHFMGCDWQINTVCLYDSAQAESDKFAGHLERDKHSEITVCDDSASLLAQSDIIVLATDSLGPHITDPTVLQHNPIILNISLRDLTPEVIISCRNITDDVDHAVREGTSLQLAEDLAGNRNFLDGTLYELMTDQIKQASDKPFVFSPFGLGMLDLALGKYVYDLSRQDEKRIVVENFFFETER